MDKHTRSVSLVDGHIEGMTGAEIKKALEDYRNSPIIFTKKGIISIGDIIDLINRQQAEIERLNIRNKTLTAITKNYDWKFTKAKSEAIKEFWKRFDKVLCENIGPSKRVYWKISSDGNNLVKEMTEGK